MDYIKRDKSLITGKNNLEHLYTLNDFPVFLGCVDTPAEDDILIDMSWSICPETGLVQLDKLVPLEILYGEQHVDGTGPTWQKYYNNFVNYIIEKNPKNILEIGGGKGTLAEIFISETKDTTWTIIEPSPLHPGSDRINIINGFFDNNFIYNGDLDTVIFSQVLEHSYDPNEFIRNISNYLKPGQKLIFAYPQLKLWMEKKQTNAINFEHTMLLTDYFLDYLLVKYGFKIIEKEIYEDHSIFYTCERVKNQEELPVLENKYEEYKKLFMDFMEYHLNMIKDLNKKIDSTNEPIYLFGGHIFSQYLIKFGLKTNKIISILDNSNLKINKRLYGTSLMVDSPKILKDKGKVNLILKAGIYNEEIKKDILENINNQVVFW